MQGSVETKKLHQLRTTPKATGNAFPVKNHYTRRGKSEHSALQSEMLADLQLVAAFATMVNMLISVMVS